VLNLSQFRFLGVVFILLALPAAGLLVTGNLQRGGNAYVPLSLGGLLLGGLYLLYGTGRYVDSFPAEAAAKIGWIALIQFPFMLGAWMLMRSGQAGFEIAYRFLGMFISFLAILAVVFIIAALRRGRV
jgi:hypothetical protein